jgi:L-ascorbate metabolism protein UlaG (beta-lactamase superfamily)
MPIQLEFVGHACFRLWQDGHPSIVTDPYTHAAVKLPDDGTRLEADIVIVSSLTDSGHDNVKFVKGNPRVINAYDVARLQATEMINGEPVITVEAAEIADHPEGTDPNALYAFRAGDLWFLHMGDLGFGLSAEQLQPFAGHCDVLLALVGENLTLSLEALDPMIEFLQPIWIVPMHYGLPPIAGVMSTVDKFLQRHPRSPVFVARHHTVTFPLPVSGNGHPTIVVLEPSSYTATGGLPEFHCS